MQREGGGGVAGPHSAMTQPLAALVQAVRQGGSHPSRCGRTNRSLLRPLSGSPVPYTVHTATASPCRQQARQVRTLRCSSQRTDLPLPRLLLAPCVPTGMNIGVWAVKCGSVMRLERARPCVATTWGCRWGREAEGRGVGEHHSQGKAGRGARATRLAARTTGWMGCTEAGWQRAGSGPGTCRRAAMAGGLGRGVGCG